MIFWVRIAAMAVWFMGTSVVTLLVCVFRRDLSINRDYAHALGWGMLKFSGIRLKVTNYERIHETQPCIYVGNHQGVMDIGTFGRVYPRNTVVIGKRELLYIPVFGILFWAAGNILIHRQKKRKAIGSIEAATQEIRKRNASVWIFPEGTRNRNSLEMLPFKKGAFHMAVQAGVPIRPLVSGPLAPLVSWAEKRMTPGTLEIRILPLIHADPHAKDPVQDLADRTRAVMESELRDLQQKATSGRD